MENSIISLESLDSIELQFALVKTESQFQMLVWSHLKSVVLGLSSNDKNVINKSSGILGHICNRLNSETNVKLPLRQMLEMSSSKGSLKQSQKDVIMLLIEKSYDRASFEEAIEALPVMLNDIAECTLKHQAIVVGMLFSTLAKAGDLNDHDTKKFEKAIEDINESGIDYMFSHAAILMLYEILRDVSREQYVEPLPHYGEVFRVILCRGKLAWANNKTELNNMKIAILSTLIKQKIFREKEYMNKKTVVLICASVDNNSEVNSLAKLNLRSSPETDLNENPELLRLLIDLYAGRILRGLSAQPVKVPIGLKFIIARQFQRVRTFSSSTFPCEATFEEIMSANPENIESKLYIELLRLGLKIINDLYAEPSSLYTKNVLKVFLQHLEFCMGTEDGKLETARSLIYQIIGTLCKKIDFSEYDAKTALFKLFWGLCYDTHGVRLVIQKVILELFPLLKNAKLTDNYEQSIIDLTLECITGNNYEALYCLVLFINSVFSFNSIEAKYINIVAIKRSKHGLEEAGYNGLKFPDPPRMPEKEEDINYTIRKWRERLPNFLEFIGLLSQLMRGKNTYKLKYYDAIAKVENVEKEKFFGAVTMGTLTLGLEFSRQLFILSADPWANRSCLGTVGTLGTNETWIEGVSLIQRVTDYIKYLCTPADNIQQEYRTNENIYVKPGRHRSTAEMPSLEAYTNLVLRALRSPQSENILKIVCIHILTEIIHYLPRTILNSLYEDIQLLESMLSSMNPQVSHGSARLIGALVTKSPYVEAKNNQFVKLVEKLMADSVRPEKKMILTSINSGIKVALGSIVGNLLRNYSSEASRYVSEENIIVIMDILTSELINPRSIVAANLPSACIAVSEACRYGPIFTWSHMSDSEIRHFSDQLIGERVEPPRKYSSKPLLLISRLIYLLESCTEQKLQECLSNMLCDLAISSLAVREVLLKYFMSIAFRFSKKIDSLAILGESLCKLICGKDFVLSGRYFFIPGASGALSTESRNCPENASSALAELALDHLISSTSSNGRGSAGSKESLVLLLCIAKLCAQEPLVVEKFMYIAKAFMKFLPNGNELISNIASYGIYTLLCNARDDEKLLLVNLMNNELYREPSKYMNAVDSAGSARVSTYVSISALSCDLNAPDLTYKMLMIAWADIHWTSRSWAIRSSPGMLTPTYEDFSEYIEEIIPGLFVLKFHPNRKTSSDIDKLWKTLVKNPEDAINDYKKEICIKILHSIKQESRVAKEQGCAALEDFVSKVNLLQIFDNILVIYSALFEIFDHIEESVRNYAFSAGRALCNALINFVNDVASPISVRMQIISDLVDKLSRQIVSPDKSIEKFCLSIIYKMQECSPKVLENSLKTLIGILLQCLTSLSTHTSGHPTFHSVARSSLSQQHEHSNFESIKMSPIMGALVRFYAALSEDEANNVMFHVIDMLGSATRFSEKAAYLAFLYQTSESVPYKWTFNGQIVPDIFLPLIKSSSNVLSTAASLAISSLCRNSSTIMAASLKKITYLYFEERSGSPKHLLGLCTYQILKGKKFLEKDVLEDFAPTAYIASRNIAGGGQIESWGKVWECVYSLIPTGDNGRIMSMCIKIAIPIVEHGQQSNLKVQAANAVKEMCSKADCDISEDLAPKLLHAFIRALGVCSDEVKHELILSFADVVEHLSWYINKRESHCLNRRIVLDIFLDGINSGDAEIVYYSLSSIVRIYAKVGIGLYSVVQQPIMTVARSFNNKNHSRILNSLRGRTLELEIRLMAFRALEKLWCISKVEMEDYLDEIVVFLVSCLRECVWNIQDAILSTLIPFIRDSNISDSKNNPEDKNSIKIEHLVQCTKAVLECARTAKYTETIKRAFDCLEILVMKLEQSRSIMLESSLREMSLICETLSNSSAGVHITTVFNRVKARVQPLPANI